jgi:hypothetical protein
VTPRSSSLPGRARRLAGRGRAEDRKGGTGESGLVAVQPEGPEEEPERERVERQAELVGEGHPLTDGDLGPEADDDREDDRGRPAEPDLEQVVPPPAEEQPDDEPNDDPGQQHGLMVPPARNAQAAVAEG